MLWGCRQFVGLVECNLKIDLLPQVLVVFFSEVMERTANKIHIAFVCKDL